MSTILVNFYDKIRASVNASELVRNYVSLQKKGDEFLGVCPFHNEKTPSFTVNDRKKFYHCFGCGAHGDIIKFEAEQAGISYKDAAYKIADKFGIERPVFTKEQEKEQEKFDRLLLLLSLAMNFFISNLNPKIKDILHKRNITDELSAKYKIGYTGPKGSLIEYFNKKNVRLEELEACGLVGKNPDGKYYEIFRERIIIPIFSQFGKVIAFGGRSMGQEMPKYLNSPETILFKKGECVYGEDIASAAAYKSGKVILVEGYFDVIAMHKAGFNETVASLGTAVTTTNLQKLWKIAGEIIVCLDGDESGIRASQKLLSAAIPLVNPQNIISFVTLPKKLDPDELVNQYGPQIVSSVINDRMGFSEYIFYSLTNEKTFSSPEEKAKLEIELDNIANKIKEPYIKKNVSHFFKKKTWELFNNKITSKPAKKSSNRLFSPTNQIDNIENVILCFLINSSGSFSLEEISGPLQQIAERNEELKDIIETIFNIISSKDSSSPAYIIEELKKTRFWTQFELLSTNCNRLIPATQNEIDKKEMLNFLLSKRHLICLTNELSAIASTEDSKLEEKLEFYLEEIKKTNNTIEKFNTLLTNK